MSGYKGYKIEDNARRKSNNTGDELEDIGQNKNVKCWSTKPGQLSTRDQVNDLAKKQKELNKKQEVKYFTREEIQALYGKKCG